MTFDAASAAIEAVIAAERSDDRVDPICYTRVMSHGAAVERAIVFFHGFTNCPQQFVALGTEFFEAGFNVYIPRLPEHGLRDKMTTALAHITVADLTSAAERAAQIAVGLGTRVHVAGISLGGVLAAWVGEKVAITGATAISPFFAIAGVPMWVSTVIAAVFETLPTFFIWWDPASGPKNPHVPPYAYARYPSRALAEQLRLSALLQRDARTRAPQAHVSCLFYNLRDPAVNNAVAKRLYDRWTRAGSRVLEQPFDGGLRHDIIDNFDGHLPVDRIYPAILKLVTDADRTAA